MTTPRDLATVCPAAAAQYDAAGTNPAPSSQTAAGSNKKADFLLDCGHTITRSVKDHVMAHQAGRPSAATCTTCHVAAINLGVVCPAAAAQYDAAGTNPVPSSQTAAGSNKKAEFLLGCGHRVTREIGNHVKAHQSDRPGAELCSTCALAGTELAIVCPSAAAQYDAAGTNPTGPREVSALSNRKVELLLDCGHIVTRRLDHHVAAHRTGRPSATRCPECRTPSDPSAGEARSATHS